MLYIGIVHLSSVNVVVLLYVHVCYMSKHRKQTKHIYIVWWLTKKCYNLTVTAYTYGMVCGECAYGMHHFALIICCFSFQGYT